MGAILIIDDDDTNNFYVKFVLSKLGITDNYFFALNGQEALNILADLRIENISTDLIVLDINMPIMNGFEFLDAFDQLPESQRKETKIALMSSSANEADKKKALTYKSIYRQIEKPLTADKLGEILFSLG